MSHDSFTPKYFPRTRLPSGRVLSDSQQYQYDVLRSGGGEIVRTSQGWFRELSPSHRQRIYGLNLVAMFKLVELGLIEYVADPGLEETGYRFALQEQAKTIPGPRIVRVNQLIKELS
jgi:hypothetical protein